MIRASMRLANVAPLAGARIETVLTGWTLAETFVAPLAGARIETSASTIAATAAPVAPLAGARIETGLPKSHDV